MYYLLKLIIQKKLRLITGGHGFDDIGVARVGDRKRAHAEVLSAGGAELDVVAGVVVNASLRQHSVVLDFRFSEQQKEYS